MICVFVATREVGGFRRDRRSAWTPKLEFLHPAPFTVQYRHAQPNSSITFTIGSPFLRVALQDWFAAPGGTQPTIPLFTALLFLFNAWSAKRFVGGYVQLIITDIEAFRKVASVADKSTFFGKKLEHSGEF